MATKKVQKETVTSAAVPKKKVVKKAAVKKTTAKKVASKSQVCAKCSIACPPEQAFWVNNGPVVDTLAGLKEALACMSDEQYAYHTERAGNDFAAWVRDCMGDTGCAVRIAQAKTRQGAVRALTCVCV